LECFIEVCIFIVALKNELQKYVFSHTKSLLQFEGYKSLQFEGYKVRLCSRAGAANGKEPTGSAETVIQGDGLLQGHKVASVCGFRV
jgi:hypothetical protein